MEAEIISEILRIFTAFHAAGRPTRLDKECHFT